MDQQRKPSTLVFFLNGKSSHSHSVFTNFPAFLTLLVIIKHQQAFVRQLIYRIDKTNSVPKV